MSEAIQPLDSVSEKQLTQARKTCAAITHKHAGNFYYAFMFMEREKRLGIEALYAFCRIGDDLADESPSLDSAQVISTEGFEQLHQRLDLCFQGFYTDDLTLSLADAIQRFGFERIHFDELLLGLESDLTMTRYETFEQLRQYCYRVASTVGLLCLKIFDCDTDKSRRYAEYLGIGMQLTNILRDLREDYDRGRIYLPQTDMKKFGLEGDDLFAQAHVDRLEKLIHWEAERAEGFFIRAEVELTPDLRKQLVIARIMGAIYRKILERIIEHNQFDERIELTTWEKMQIARNVFAESLR
ncbi:MAG: phytoene/squalene synthase family protein [Candidatus Electryoneaceae bacterium]|nr:phytoene/squalene synthase family protein [Candidatus Electryoneaceae bacterium]